VGIRTRGWPLAARLAAWTRDSAGATVEVGALDITLYRDDVNLAVRRPVLRGTEIPFSLDDTELVLVDDVLATGRTVRAALGAISDLGRPARVRLAVLVDRGSRELPVQADVVGIEIPCRREDRIRVGIRPIDELDEIRLIRSAPST
jgi:pyrimidine operon attenuation protein/uracil phosphoribosyltransferase